MRSVVFQTAGTIETETASSNAGRTCCLLCDHKTDQQCDLRLIRSSIDLKEGSPPGLTSHSLSDALQLEV